jgi:hypothetical protein
MRFAPLLLLGFLSTAHADESVRPYSRPLATTGIVVGATGFASVAVGTVWTIVVLAGPETPEPCRPYCWFGDSRPTWDMNPGLAMIGIGASSMLLGAALAAVGLTPEKTRVGASGVTIAF